MRRKIGLIIISLLALLSPLYGALPTYRHFDHVGVEQGLSSNTITSIVQDSLGVMWIGTHAGLNSFDGSHVRVYENRVGDANSLPENRIMQLEVDGMKLYVRTINHVTVYDIAREKFTNIDVLNLQSIALSDGVLHVATQSEVSLVDLTTSEVVLLDIPFESIYSHYIIQTIKRSGDLLYVGTDRGLAIYNVKTGELSQLLRDKKITRLYIDRSDDLWVATAANGAYLVADEQIVDNFSTPTISHNFVRDIQEDSDGNVWLGTIKGLEMINLKEHSATTYGTSLHDATQLSHNSIWEIFCDRNGVMWIGTYFGGVNILDTTASLFSYYNISDGDADNMLGNIVGSIVEDASGGLYLGTHGGGLSYFDTRSGDYKNYIHSEKQRGGIGCNNIQDLWLHDKSRLIIATNTDGINILNIDTQTFESLNGSPSARKVGIGRSVAGIDKYKNNSYLISADNGVYIFDMDDYSFTPLSRNVDNEAYFKSKITTAMVASNGMIWLGGETQGLAMYNPYTDELKRYHTGRHNQGAIPSNEINEIYEDYNSRIWVSTLSGLSLYQPVTDSFKTYTTQQGLPSNAIYEIQGSRYEELVVTSPVGFSVLSASSGKVRSFTANNGMPLSLVTQNSLLYSRSGTIYIGGHNGLLAFNEGDILHRDIPMNTIVVTSLKAMGDYVVASKDSKILKTNIALCDEVVLPYNKNSIEINFSDLEMRAVNRGSLEYMLEGFDDHFIAAGSANSAVYNNLPYKDYRFVVRYADAPTDELTSVLDLHVQPPFYLSMTAFILYILSALMALIVITRLYYQRRLALATLKIEQRDRERDKEYNESKLRFFTNISHELRTPLSLISGQLEHIIDDSSLDPAPYNRVLQSYKSVGKLQSLVDELLDLRKQQNGFATFEMECCNLRVLAHEVFVNYIELAADRGLEYNLNIEGDEDLFVTCDKRAIDKVLFNLLSNAFKFTREGGVTISITQKDSSVEISVKDSGEGIDNDNIDHIFERFYQEGERTGHRDGVPRGSGIGLALVKGIIEAHNGTISVESKKGVGSTFTFDLPLATNSVPCIETIDAQAQEADSVSNSVIDSDKSIDEVIAKLKSKGVDKEKLILVVEDNVAMQEFLYDVLSAHYQVEVAGDGEEGYAKAIDMQPSLILSDVMMPKMSGTQMCAKLKENILTGHIPVVLLTAKVALEHKIEGLELGADDYIKKPFSVRLLVARITNILESRRKIEERLFSRIDTAHQEAQDEANVVEALEAPTSESDADSEFVTKALRVAEENISNEEYSVDQFAADMFMGRTNFFKKLNRLVGMTPNEVLLSVRLKRSVELITKGGMSIAEISDQCGFNTQQYFSRCFKRKFGCTPAQYLKKGRSEGL